MYQTQFPNKTPQKQPFGHNYILHNHIVESVTSAKYIGITIQSKLKWNLHYDNIISIGNKALKDVKSRACLAFVSLRRTAEVYGIHIPTNIKWRLKRCRGKHLATLWTITTTLVVPNTMIDTLGWPTLAECRLKTRLIMLYKLLTASWPFNQIS